MTVVLTPIVAILVDGNRRGQLHVAAPAVVDGQAHRSDRLGKGRRSIKGGCVEGVSVGQSTSQDCGSVPPRHVLRKR
jgi:hypothetical protein